MSKKDPLDHQKLLELYPDYDIVYDNIINPENRRMVCLYKRGERKRTTTAYAKALLEVHLGKRLENGFEADHIDNDKTNDTIANLQVLTARENREKFRAEQKVKIICPNCNRETILSLARVLSNRRLGKSGPYCGRSCAGQANFNPKIRGHLTDLMPM